MKVILVNGGPHEKGCTFTALSEVATALNKNGVDTEIFWIGNNPIGGCTACGFCQKHGKCFRDDSVNTFVEKAETADGFIFGSPVHYAAPAGAMLAFLGRVFFSKRGTTFVGKPGAAVVSCRRAGATAALDVLNKFFSINKMPVPSSQYWNMVHGNTPDEVRRDLEGLQIMRTLGNSMAYMLKCKQAAEQAGVPAQVYEKGIFTNFIR